MLGFVTPEFLMLAGQKILRIGAILLVTTVLLRFFRLLVSKMFIPQLGSKPFFEEKRAKTLTGLLQSIIRYAAYFIALVLILQEFQIDTTSIVAGAGIVGLALGVGAQNLIRDVITGFFIILENQFAVGDYIVSGDMAGTVEDIGFRVTKLRDGSGVLHIIPHGAISRVTNYSRGHMQAVINVPIAYEVDMKKVLALLEQACSDVAKTREEVLEGPKVVGVVDLRPNDWVIRLTAKTVPLEQVKVETALRKRVKELFDEAQIPPPHSQAEKGG